MKRDFGVTEGGPFTIVTDGLYKLTDLLITGNNTIHLRSSLICPDVGCVELAFAQDVKFNIIVVPCLGIFYLF